MRSIVDRNFLMRRIPVYFVFTVLALLLTVLISITLHIKKTNLMHYLSSVYFLNPLYMFRAGYCPSSGGITVYIQQLVRVVRFS
jgi:hypothetical protein